MNKPKTTTENAICPICKSKDIHLNHADNDYRCVKCGQEFEMNKPKTKTDEIVLWLREKQSELQKEFKLKIGKMPKSKSDLRGVWINSRCRCGNSFSTPFFIRDNGKCRSCGKRFCRVKE